MTFILATASRCGAARVARRRNLDFKAKTWTVPTEDLKDEAYRSASLIVPLNSIALSALSHGGGEFLFTDKRGRPFAEHDIANFIRTLRRLHPDWVDPDSRRPFTAHGMRSTFRSWAAATRQDRELVELAMGHSIYGQVESAYVRDPLHEHRAELMQRWGYHCCARTADVLPIRA